MLAIAEYLAEIAPQAGLLPADIVARALSRRIRQDALDAGAEADEIIELEVEF